MNNTLILMSDNRSLNQNLNNSDYNTLSTIINYEYAIKHNYSFLYLTPKLYGNYEYLNCLSPSGEKRHPSWSKLLSIIKIMEEHKKYELILYLDSDCIFNNFEIKIDDYLKNSKTINNIFLNLESDIFFMNNLPWNDDLPCAGFFIIKNNIKSLMFLKEWFNMENDITHNTIHPWEQTSLQNDLFVKYNNIEIINDWMFREYPNQYLRHIGSEESQNRIPFFLKKINDLGLYDNFNIVINNIIKNHNIEYNTNDIKTN